MTRSMIGPQAFLAELERATNTRVPELRNFSFRGEHRLLKQGELAVECFETRVWTVQVPGEQAAPVPQEIRGKFAAGGERTALPIGGYR